VGNFVSLHHHTTFSYLDGYGMPETHIERAVELGMRAQAFTEHGNVTSHVKAEQAGIKHGVKPIFGIEAYTGGVGEDKGRFKWHLTILAMNDEGYRNLLRLTSLGWAEGFYYEPTISGEMLAKHNEGLIVLSGCSGSKLAVDLLGGKGTPEHNSEPDYQAAVDTAMKFKELLGDRYYLEVQQFPELERSKAMNIAYEKIGRELGIPLVATCDVHYPQPADNKVQLVLHAVDRGGKNNTVEKQAQGWGYDVKLTLWDDDTLFKRMRDSGLSKKAAQEALRNTGVIADRCDVKLPKLKELEFPSPEPAEQLLRAWVKKGWAYRNFDNLPKKLRREYKERVKFELDLISKKNFSDYFLVVSDMTRWAKNNDIPVGPARGSAAGSLVCFLLRITEVNPMLFTNLLFARFIDEDRHDLPDIDLDFDDEQRYKIREYLVDQYGADRVGNIGTFTNYKGKNSIDDVARTMGVPYQAAEVVKEMLIERSSGDLRDKATIEDTMEMFPKVKEQFKKYPQLHMARRLEGNLRGFSVHAAGLVVANEPLTNSCAVYTRRDDKTGEVVGNVLSIDKHDAEYINALKIDALGLTTMGVISRCLKMCGMTLEELYAIPLDEEAVFDGFKRNEVIGIFQFDGRAARSVNREVKPDNFNEVCDINALVRPGPLHSGATADYIQAKFGTKKIIRTGTVVDTITQYTQGQIVYQEQILETVRALGNFSWEDAAKIRKIISKKQGEQEFNRQMGKFLKGAAENGVSEITASRIWKQLVTAGAYAFNRAHCISYGMLAYWTMWLKQNYPIEFYCAGLQKYKFRDGKTQKGFDLLKEAISRGFDVLPPDPVLSQETWSIHEGKLLAGLMQVDGIGPSTAPKLIEYRDAWARANDGDMTGFTWSNYEAVAGIGAVTIGKIEAFASEEDPFGVYRVTRVLKKVRRYLWEEGEMDGLPFPGSKSENVPYEAVRGEHVWLGYVTDINLKDIYELHRSRTGEELDPATVKEPEHVNYVALLGEDETGPLSITIQRYRGLYESYKDMIWSMDTKRDLLLVRGYKRSEYRRAIYAQEVWVINPENIK
jgi:DNA polymerase-3 subunit alpha